MNNLLYLVAVIVIILWALGYFAFSFGGSLIHILLIIAVIAVLLGIIRRGNI